MDQENIIIIRYLYRKGLTARQTFNDMRNVLKNHGPSLEEIKNKFDELKVLNWHTNENKFGKQSKNDSKLHIFGAKSKTNNMNEDLNNKTSSNDTHLPDFSNKNLDFDSSFNGNVLEHQIKVEPNDLLESNDRTCLSDEQIPDMFQEKPKKFNESEQSNQPENKIFLCDVCGNTFRQELGLNRHIKKHMGDLRYKCGECGKRFVQSDKLKRHSVVHSGEKPFVCPICHKKFTQKAHLNVHIKAHNGDRRYSCQICNKKFASAKSLTNHRKTHSVVEWGKEE